MSQINEILERKAALERQIARFEHRLLMANSELAQIKTTLSVLNKYGVHSPIDNSSSPPETVADMALEIIKEAPNGLKADIILKEIRRRWKPRLARTSLSPPLSRLKK